MKRSWLIAILAVVTVSRNVAAHPPEPLQSALREECKGDETCFATWWSVHDTIIGSVADVTNVTSGKARRANVEKALQLECAFPEHRNGDESAGACLERMRQNQAAGGIPPKPNFADERRWREAVAHSKGAADPWGAAVSCVAEDFPDLPPPPVTVAAAPPPEPQSTWHYAPEPTEPFELPSRPAPELGPIVIIPAFDGGGGGQSQYQTQ